VRREDASPRLARHYSGYMKRVFVFSLEFIVLDYAVFPATISVTALVR
jgi:hypothetical protein